MKESPDDFTPYAAYLTDKWNVRNIGRIYCLDSLQQLVDEFRTRSNETADLLRQFELRLRTLEGTVVRITDESGR